MKHGGTIVTRAYMKPAAFRRLCVETLLKLSTVCVKEPAAFRRLCVETRRGGRLRWGWAPAAFRRLCVETHSNHSFS